MPVQVKVGSRGSLPVIPGLTWTSSDSSILSVGTNATMVEFAAKKPGNVKLTMAAGGDFHAELDLTVAP